MKINKKLLGFGTLALPIVVAASMFFAMNPNINLLNKAKAGDDTIEGSVTFSRSSGSWANPSSGVYVAGSHFSGGSNIYSYTAGSSSPGSYNIANVSGNSGEIHFSSSNTALYDFKFQNLTAISVTTDSTNIVYFSIFTSNDGQSFAENTKVSYTGSLSNYSISGVRYVYLKMHETSASTNIGVKSIKIDYSCSPSYHGDDLVSIDLTDIITSYDLNDTFIKPTVTATYFDESTKVVTDYATFSGFDSTTPGEKTIEVTYSENGITVSSSFVVLINSSAGKTTADLLTEKSLWQLRYANASSYNYVTFAFETTSTGTFKSYYDDSYSTPGKTITFHYSIDANDVLTITSIDSTTGDGGASYRTIKLNSTMTITVTNKNITRMNTTLTNVNGVNERTYTYTA